MFAMAFFGEPDETAPAVDGRRQGESSRFVERERVRRRAGCRVARVGVKRLKRRAAKSCAKLQPSA